MSDDRWVRSREALIVIGLILAGIALRMWWISLIPRTSETWHVAVSLATTGHFADTFRPGSGPTAHVAPVMPLLIAGVYRIFGISTPAAEWVLSLISAGLIGVSIGFAYLLMRALGMSLRPRIAAVALVSLLPIQFSMEMRELKVWEAPLAVAGITGLLALVVRLDSRGIGGAAGLVPALGIAAFLMLLSPPAGLAGFVVIAILVIRRIAFKQWPAVVALTLLVTACFIAPWALHNRAALGRPILTRSDPGLELAVGLNDTMLHATDERAAMTARLRDIHPITPKGYDAMQAAGGEVAYNAVLGKQTMAWITGHPEGTAILLARHVREYFLPPEWFFNPFGTVNSRSAALRGAYLAVAVWLALCGLPMQIARNRRYIYLLAALAVLVLPYLLVQPILRYRYLIYTLSGFLAVDVVATLWALYRKPKETGEAAPQ
ncbi:hypothetical protein KZX46_09335 [Polymorphobacter sp. PAMC 29334]|uniref:hypothetical protein n=1 Tax=Polymorphobacter sp. PAMC 29334 TaxID=2862331 RepID=UPI001C748F09|nr:hypothetical protein [Polymorphobacter sp. PAMC 29334]QYE36110.1 hypothetical protein KZX46_09335 [Polymorphobacter sp. PAMC 29334]